MEADKKLPLEEAAKIQDALKSLGYVVEGYCNGLCTENRLILLYLTPPRVSVALTADREE